MSFVIPIHLLTFDTQHAELVAMPHQLVNTCFLLCYHTKTRSALILTLPTFSFLILLIFWHCVISPLFPVFPILTRSAVFSPRGRLEHSKPLHLGAIHRHLVPPGQFVTMLNARRRPWGWPVVVALADTQWEKKKVTEKEWGRGAEGEWTWQRSWNISVPLSRAMEVCSLAVSTSH